MMDNMDRSDGKEGISTFSVLNGKTENEARQMYTFCRQMPKCEFHAHLSGCINRKMLHALDLKRRKWFGSYVLVEKLNEQCEKRFGSYVFVDRQSIPCEYDRTPKNVQEAFELFPLIQELIVYPEDVTEVTIEVIRDFSMENVVYLELRSTPRCSMHMSKDEYVRALISGVIHAERLFRNICVRILLSIDRRQTLAEAEETLNLAVKYGKRTENVERIVIGVDISGDPKYDARKFLPLLNKFRGDLSVISFHLAELKEHMDEVQECLHFGPTRIGHATFLHQIPDTTIRDACMDYVFTNQIPIEICLSSNLICGTVESVKKSHLVPYYERKHPILLCTDDRAMMCCSLSDEYTRVARALNLNFEQIFNLSYSTINYICQDLSQTERDLIMSKFHSFAKSHCFDIKTAETTFV